MTILDLIKFVGSEVRLAKGFRLKSIALFFRLANYYYHGQSVIRYGFLPFVIFYKVYVEFLLGIELPAMTRVGLGLKIFHGIGLVVHRKTIIGQRCILRHGVTIGNKSENDSSVPVIGNDVEFGTNAVVIGQVNIGDNVIVGAGTVVTKDIPSGSVVVASKFRILE